jgi:hypothetical protein
MLKILTTLCSGDKHETYQKAKTLYIRTGICYWQHNNADRNNFLHIYGMGTMSLKNIYENNLNEFIRYGEFDPSDKALFLVWQHLKNEMGAGDFLSEVINGDDLLSDDLLNFVVFNNPGDQGKLRLQDACNRYAMYFVEQDADIIWSMWDGTNKPDPMDLAKESRYIDEIAGSLKGIF